jgi:hypothetical protein
MSKNSSNHKTKKSNKTKNFNLLKQIQLNTAAQIAQQVPDTVVMPVLKESSYSVILGASTTFTNTTTVPVFPTLNFTGSLFNDFANYATVFDKYRFLEVEVDFICVNPSQNGNGLFVTCIDYDDDAALSSLNQILDYKNAYTTNTAANFKRTLIPRCTLAAYSGAFTSYAEAKAGQWLDCASNGIIHYALKCYLGPSIPITQYQIVIRAHLQFKNQH